MEHVEAKGLKSQMPASSSSRELLAARTKRESRVSRLDPTRPTEVRAATGWRRETTARISFNSPLSHSWRCRIWHPRPSRRRP